MFWPFSYITLSHSILSLHTQMVSAKGKEKATDSDGKGKRKWTADDDKTGRKRKYPGVAQYIDISAYRDDKGEDSSEDSSEGFSDDSGYDSGN